MSGNKFKETLVFPASATLAGVYFYKQHRELFISSIILNPFFFSFFFGVIPTNLTVKNKLELII
jgi:hypothetical protein